MSTTVSQTEGLLNKDLLLMEAVCLNVAMKVPVLPTPALQCTRIGAGSACVKCMKETEGEEADVMSLTFCMMERRVVVVSGTE